MNKLIRALCIMLAALLALNAFGAGAEIFVIPNGVAAIESEAFSGVDFPDGVLIPPTVTHIGQNAFSTNVIYGLEGSAAQAYAQENDLEFRGAGISGLAVEAPAFASPYRPFEVKVSCVSPLPVDYNVRFYKNGACLAEVSAIDGVASATLLEGGLYDIGVTAQNGIGRAEAYFEGEIEIYEPVHLIASSWTVRAGEAFCPVDEAETRSVTLSCADPAISIEGGSVTATATGVYTVTAQTECEGLPVYTDFTVNCVIPVDALTTSEADVELYIGESFAPEIRALPENASPYTLDFASSDPAVASVDACGTVTALSQGQCRVSVSTFDAAGEISIRVKQPAQTLNVSSERVTLQTGAQQQLSFEISPANADDVAVVWSSSDPSIASVTPRSGLVTGLTPGDCLVTARLSSQTELEVAIPVTVTQGVTEIRAEIPSILYAGDSCTIHPVVLPQEAGDARIQYAVSDESVLAVSPDGELDALNPGRALVTLTAPNWVSASYEVQVYERCEAIVPRISELVLNPGLSADASALFSFLPAGVPAENASYTSSDPSILSIDAQGRISALSAGSANIEAHLDEAVYSLPVRVVTDGKVISSVSLSQYYAVLTPGATVSVTPSFGNAAAKYKRGAWYSDAPQVVSVASTASNGTVTLKALSPGKATVTLLSSSGCSASLLLIVNPVAVKSISVKAPAEPLYPGDSVAISYTCSPSGADTSGVFLYSSDDSVATVSEDGTLTAVGAGACDIFVSCDTALASFSITVNGRPMTLAALASDTLLGMAGEGASIQYSFEPYDASPARFAWQSDDPAIAEVSASGHVSFLSAGTTQLHGTATDGSGLKLELSVQVSEIPLRALEPDFDSLDLEYGQSRQITCAVYPQNASYSEVRFASSDESVALVDESGMVTALREGSAVIFASAGHGDYLITRTVEVNVTRPSSTVYRAFIMGQFTVPGADGYLPFSVNGTRGVHDAISQSTLGGAAYQINYLPASPSVESVRAALSSLAAQADPDDVTFLYLLTHGSYTDSSGYFLQFSNGAHYYADQLISDVSRISGHVVLVLCTCHSGRVFGSAKLKAIVSAGGAYTGAKGPGHLSVLCSSTDTNSSYYKTLNALQSYDFFTRAFTLGLGWNMLSDVSAPLAADSNGDARVTLSELAPWSRSKTQQLISSFVQLKGTSEFGGNQNQFPRYFIAAGDEDLALTERR